MSQHWLLKATMERVVWRRSRRSPEKSVSVCLSGLVFIAAELQSVAEFTLGVCSVIRAPMGVLPGLRWVILLLAFLQGGDFGTNLRREAKNKYLLTLFGKRNLLDDLGAKSNQMLNYSQI